MRVLLVHNHLRPPSGENTVFAAERKLLAEHGTETVLYEKCNDNIKRFGIGEKFRLPFRVIWSDESYRDVRLLIKKEKPDIVHFHNTFPLISPSAYYACKAEGVPVVQTLHSHRLICPGGYLLRDGSICRECIDKGLLRAVKASCYHESRVQTSWSATMLCIHRKLGTWDKKVDCYIALTSFAKELYGSAGLPIEKIAVKPNFIENLALCRREAEGFGIFIGRLSREKGVDLLLSAIQRAGDIHFKVIGDGPLRRTMEDKKRDLDLRKIEFCGYKLREEALLALSRASFFVLPSICYEGFPMVILEAMSLGKPVITTNLGGLPEIIKDGYNGFLVPPGDVNTLAEKMKLLANNRDLCESLGRNARKEYEAKYTPEKNYEMLLGIYSRVIERKRVQQS